MHSHRGTELAAGSSNSSRASYLKGPARALKAPIRGEHGTKTESELREGDVVTCDNDRGHLYEIIGFRAVSVHLLAELRPKQDGKLRWAPVQCLHLVPIAEALRSLNDRAEEEGRNFPSQASWQRVSSPTASLNLRSHPVGPL
jgi:hypothetical protein